jgi:hypothetical protein
MNYNAETLKALASKYHYVFVGCNATTGKPHPITGRLSNYGSFIAFKSKADALRYVSEYRCNGFGEFAKAGTVNTLRRYKQGLSLFQYYDSLLMLDALSYDAEGNLI